MNGTNYFTGGTVDIALVDGSGNAVLAKGTAAAKPASKAGYAIGCIYMATDTGVIYSNVGTAASSTFTAVNAGTGELTSAHILVGNGSNVATDVALSGDATMANTGAISVTKLTIASAAAGDILYYNGTAWVRLAKGTAGQVLTMNAGATAPEWQTP